MKIKLIFILIFGMLFISMASAYTWGIQKQNACVNISAVCPLPNCNYTKIDFLILPNNTMVLNNAVAIHYNTSWIYNFCITDKLGIYTLKGYSKNSSETIYFEGNFKITPSGRESTTAESILYFVMVLVMLSICIVIFYFILVLPYENERDESGNVTGIIKLKYLKIFFIALIYPLFIVLLNLLNGLANNFTTLSIFANQIGFIEEMLIRLAWPFFIIIAIWIIFLLIRDTNFKRLMKKEAYYHG